MEAAADCSAAAVSRDYGHDRHARIDLDDNSIGAGESIRCFAGALRRRSTGSNATSAANPTKLSGIVHETADQTGECLMLTTRFNFSEKISEFDFGRHCAG